MSDQYTPVDWSYNTNIYEVNLRQYTAEGTFKAFERELPRLKDMGVEVLWFMPVTPISKEKRLGILGSYYACSDYIASNPEYGSVEDFKQLVKAAHQLNLRVIIDWVANHTGWDHRWVVEHPEYYRKNHNGEFFDQHGWEDVIDLNYDHPQLHTAMIAAMRFWIDECDIDGFRCDMAMLVPLTFWRTARTTLDKIKPLFWLAECEEISYHEVFDATYAWKLLHKMESFWKKETDIHGLEEVLHYYSSMFPKSAFHLFFTTNHDENSHSGSEYERLGNAVEAFAVLSCTWNGIPLIYSGQEMPNKKRLKFFEKDAIEWNGEYFLHDFFKTLLALRKRNSALEAGECSETYRLVTGVDHLVFAYLRRQGSDEVLVVLNLSHDNVAIRVSDEKLSGTFSDIFTLEEHDVNGTVDLKLKPWQHLILEKVNNIGSAKNV
jgi:glycosidase